MIVYEVTVECEDAFYTAYTEVICASREIAEAWIKRKPEWEQTQCEIVETEVLETQEDIESLLVERKNV